MAGVEYKYEGGILPFVVDIAYGAKDARHAHEFLDGSWVVIIIQSELLVLFGEGFL